VQQAKMELRVHTGDKLSEFRLEKSVQDLTEYVRANNEIKLALEIESLQSKLAEFKSKAESATSL